MQREDLMELNFEVLEVKEVHIPEHKEYMRKWVICLVIMFMVIKMSNMAHFSYFL